MKKENSINTEAAWIQNDKSLSIDKGTKHTVSTVGKAILVIMLPLIAGTLAIVTFLAISGIHPVVITKLDYFPFLESWLSGLYIIFTVAILYLYFSRVIKSSSARNSQLQLEIEKRRIKNDEY